MILGEKLRLMRTAERLTHSQMGRAIWLRSQSVQGYGVTRRLPQDHPPPTFDALLLMADRMAPEAGQISSA